MGHAAELEALYQQYKDRGFIVFTLLTDGDITTWANSHNLSFPVLQDSNAATLINYVRADPNFSGGYGLPTMQLLSPGLQVEIVNGYVGAAEIEAHLAE